MRHESVELCDLGAVELRDRIGRADASCVDILESCIKRIEAVNPVLNAVVATGFDRARDEARRAGAEVRAGGRLGPLHGLPLAIKDLSRTAGLRTTFGSLLFADHVPVEDDPVVARLRAAGAIVLGKTNTPEFGAGLNTDNAVYGATANPFDPSLSCGGSSGGSAVALATSMVPLATGSDLGGSLRIPAAYCGVVGMRPSPGLVPSSRRLHGWMPLLVDGPMARTVADAALFLSAMAGHDALDPLSEIAVDSIAAGSTSIDLGRLRVAFSEDLGFAPVEAAVRSIFRRRVESFAGRFKTAVWRHPDLDGAARAYRVLRTLETVAQLKSDYDRTPERLGEGLKRTIAEGLGFGLADVAQAMADQTRIYRRVQSFFEDHDLLMTPAVAMPPMGLGDGFPKAIEGRPLENFFDAVGLTYALTLSGSPCIVIPCGREHTGMPFGIQICGKRRGDRSLLAAAGALERIFSTDDELMAPRFDIAAISARRKPLMRRNAKGSQHFDGYPSRGRED